MTIIVSFFGMSNISLLWVTQYSENAVSYQRLIVVLVVLFMPFDNRLPVIKISGYSYSEKKKNGGRNFLLKS